MLKSTKQNKENNFHWENNSSIVIWYLPLSVFNLKTLFGLMEFFLKFIFKRLVALLKILFGSQLLNNSHA